MLNTIQQASNNIFPKVSNLELVLYLIGNALFTFFLYYRRINVFQIMLKTISSAHQKYFTRKKVWEQKRDWKAVTLCTSIFIALTTFRFLRYEMEILHEFNTGLLLLIIPVFFMFYIVKQFFNTKLFDFGVKEMIQFAKANYRSNIFLSILLSVLLMLTYFTVIIQLDSLFRWGVLMIAVICSITLLKGSVVILKSTSRKIVMYLYFIVFELIPVAVVYIYAAIFLIK